MLSSQQESCCAFDNRRKTRINRLRPQSLGARTEAAIALRQDRLQVSMGGVGIAGVELTSRFSGTNAAADSRVCSQEIFARQ
ncbi:protein of unknown function (plasmid) [Agrobacterium pusense]|uniref:Uncharacterized protein n=1 Tax=Agrobacterium pusense TaxID=648995 RepID=U4QHH0_9HYPH|nr:protein of unknown function [Agrobacterium pusense]